MRLHVKIMVVWISLIKIAFASDVEFPKNRFQIRSASQSDLLKLVFANQRNQILANQKNEKLSTSPSGISDEGSRISSPSAISDEELSPQERSFGLGERTFSELSFLRSPRGSIPTSDSHTSLFADFADLAEPDSLHRTTPPDGASSPKGKQSNLVGFIIACHNTTPPGSSSPKGKK